MSCCSQVARVILNHILGMTIMAWNGTVEFRLLSVPWTQYLSGLRTREFTPKLQFFEHLHRVKFFVLKEKFKSSGLQLIWLAPYMLVYVQCKMCIIEFFCFLGDENVMWKLGLFLVVYTTSSQALSARQASLLGSSVCFTE